MRHIQSLVWHTPSRIPSSYSKVMWSAWRRVFHPLCGFGMGGATFTQTNALRWCLSQLQPMFRVSLYFRTNLSFSSTYNITFDQEVVWIPSYRKLILFKNHGDQLSHDFELILAICCQGSWWSCPITTMQYSQIVECIRIMSTPPIGNYTMVTHIWLQYYLTLVNYSPQLPTAK